MQPAATLPGSRTNDGGAESGQHRDPGDWAQPEHGAAVQHLNILSRPHVICCGLQAHSLGGEYWEGGDCLMMTAAAVGCMQGIQATSCSSTLLLLTKTFSVLVTIHLNSAWPCFISAKFVCCSASKYFIFTTQHKESVSKVSNSI